MGPIQEILHQALNVYVEWGVDHNLRLNVTKTKAVYISNTYKKGESERHAYFNAGNRPILFTNEFSFLGCIIDNEMITVPGYKAVYRGVEHKIFMLGKLRDFVDRRAALLVYKQAVLPFLDYAGFVLLSCGKGCKKDMQTLEANLQSREQRRIFQILKVLYDCSKDNKYLKVTANLTRAEAKIVFGIPNKYTTTFLTSHFYKGTDGQI